MSDRAELRPLLKKRRASGHLPRHVEEAAVVPAVGRQRLEHRRRKERRAERAGQERASIAWQATAPPPNARVAHRRTRKSANVRGRQHHTVGRDVGGERDGEEAERLADAPASRINGAEPRPGQASG